METLNTIMSKLTGPEVLTQLVALLREKDKSFPEEEAKFRSAVKSLRRRLAESLRPGLDEYISACETEVIADIVYAGYLGYRANLENFHSLAGFHFVDLDFTDWLKDPLMGRFPVSNAAVKRQEKFYHAVPEQCREELDKIDSYYIHLAVAGPKLAHFAGYVISNEFLQWVEPGYLPDTCQTIDYRNVINNYFGFVPFEEEI